MELIFLFFNSFMVGFSGALMPGPLLAVGISQTPLHGWRTGPVISIGHAIAEVAVVVLLAFGVAAITEHAIVTKIIGVAGGTALILMGLSMAHDTLREKVSYELDDAPRGSAHKLAGKGIIATISNPYWFVWWATTGLAFLVKSMHFGAIGPVVFYFGHIMSDFVWYSAVSILIWKGKNIIMGKGLKTLLLLCAAFLLYLGTTFIYDGLTGSL